MSGFSGMRAWLFQRFSAIYIALFIPYIAVLLWNTGPFDFVMWKSLFGEAFLQVATSLFVVALLIHAWIGLRDVLLDYIKPIGLKMFIMAIVILTLLASGLWFLRALLLVEIT